MKFEPAKELVSYWTVGFTGHRKLANPFLIAGAIATELANLRQKVAGELAAVSSIASGGDTLFAQEALRAGLPWIALLPFPREQFRQDFSDQEWQAAEECLAQAIAEEVWWCKADRPMAYQDVGINTIDESDIVLAVWDGAYARGAGGTAEMVEYARQHRKPLVWIHAETGAVARENWPPQPFTDPAFASLRKLLGRGKSPNSGLAGFFAELDAAATRGIPKARSLETRVITFNSIAALIAGVTLALHWEAFDAVTFNFIFVALGFGAAWLLHRRKTNGKLVEARLIAEICRSLQATWDFPDRFADLYRCSVPHLGHLVRSLLLQRDLEKHQPPARDSGPDLLRFRDAYLEQRLIHQLGYYRHQRMASLPQVSRYTRAAWLASSGAVVVTFIVECVGLAFTHNPFPLLTSFMPDLGFRAQIAAPDSKVLGLIGIAAPLIASYFAALLSVNEYKRRDARYREMEQILSTAELRLRHVVTPRSIKQIVVDTETALLGENYQWYYQAIGMDGH